MLIIIKDTFVSFIPVTNNFTAQQQRDKFNFTLFYYEYKCCTEFQSASLNTFVTVFCIPFDIIQFVLTFPFIFVYNFGQCVWFPSAFIFYVFGKPFEKEKLN